jgi:hypothetical protein
MTTADSIRTFYNSGRQEIIDRLKFRDNALILYMAFLGSLVGLCATDKADWELLLSIPIVTLGITAIVSHHNEVVGSIAFFLANELSPRLESTGENAPHWENSKTLKKYASTGLKRMSYSQLLFLVGSPFLSLLVNIEHAFIKDPLFVLWVLDLALTIICLFLVCSGRTLRKEYYDRTIWFEDSKST